MKPFLQIEGKVYHNNNISYGHKVGNHLLKKKNSMKMVERFL